MPFEDASHLPKRRPGALADPRRLPRQRRGTTPQMHGRFPDFDVLEQTSHWDEPTRRVVLARLRPPAYRFFAEHERAGLERLCDVVTAQDADPRIPVLRFIDERLQLGHGRGYRYHDMPDDGEAWRRVGRGLDDAAGGSFAGLGWDDCVTLVEQLAGGRLHGGVWDTMPAERVWSLISNDIVTAYYAHPWSWNEIGFGGPAYPRGYMRLGIGQSEPWEGAETAEIAEAFQHEVEAEPGMRP